MKNCVFCKIANNEIPATKLFEDSKVLAFLDINPASKGHALVIPKKHFHTLLDVPHEELKEAMAVVQKVAGAIMNSIEGIEGFNVLQSNHEIAGQVIPHVHFHIVPRRKGDDISFEWERGKAEKDELEKYAKLVKKKL